MEKYREYLPIIAGFLISIIFGFSFLFTKIGLMNIDNDPFHLLGFRFAVAAITLTILMIFGIIKINFKGKKLHILFLLSLFQPITYFICETVGIKMTSSSEAGMMIALIPVIVTIFGALFLKEKPSLLQTVFVITSVAGVLFINIMKGETTGNITGMLILLGAIIAAGFFNVLSRKSSLHFRPVEITFIMMWVGAIVFNGISITQHALNNELDTYLMPIGNIKVVISILYLGILSSVIAFFMVNFMLSKIEASKSAVFANITTIISILAGVIILGEDFYWYHVLGGILILIGVWGTNYYGKKERTLKVKEAKIRQ
ncbi:MAG: EamA/RhaT family transporter [Firmicutes bacterium]|nr:EamA/RhaT family transporter [Bacillota bacterium]